LKLALALLVPIAGGLAAFELNRFWPGLGLVSQALVPVLVTALLYVLLDRWLVRPVLTLHGAEQNAEQAAEQLGVLATRADEIGDLARSWRSLRATADVETAEAERLNLSDSLTGLPNRLALRDTLERKLAQSEDRNEPWAVLLLDLDDFHRINATLGHDAGDEVLIQASRRFLAALDPVRDPSHPSERSGELAARISGDEFGFLLRGLSVRERARKLAEILLREAREPVMAAGRRIVVSASIGIAHWPEDGSDAQALIKSADVALFQAKGRGKNCYHFASERVQKAAADRMALEQELRQALFKGALEVHYQPIVSLGDEGVRGAEALVRWHHPQRGAIPPSVFIGIAEEFGLIEELGLFVLKRASHDAMQWPDVDGEAPFVSVNLSPRQLRQNDLAKRVSQVLRDSRLASARLHLELTESVLMDDTPGSMATLMELHDLGTRIWLDDFGTGFSGLPHLKRVPVDGMKIDKSFISDILVDRHNLALVNAIITMANSLGIAVVAEGVENATQAEVLKQMLCDLGQGYWLGPPMSQAQFLLTLRRQRRRHEAELDGDALAGAL
jgi:diguanylate cyclase (GGDEF)-like protein